MLKHHESDLSVAAYHLLTQIKPGSRTSLDFARTCATTQMQSLSQCEEEMLQMLPEETDVSLCAGLHQEKFIWQYILENPEPMFKELVNKRKLVKTVDGMFLRPIDINPSK